jgi:hypothetical protein
MICKKYKISVIFSFSSYQLLFSINLIGSKAYLCTIALKCSSLKIGGGRGSLRERGRVLGIKRSVIIQKEKFYANELTSKHKVLKALQPVKISVKIYSRI